MITEFQTEPSTDPYRESPTHTRCEVFLSAFEVRRILVEGVKKRNDAVALMQDESVTFLPEIRSGVDLNEHMNIVTLVFVNKKGKK
jgi:hypothetical protein